MERSYRALAEATDSYGIGDVKRRVRDDSNQLSLWKSVADLYTSAGDREISNAEMYEAARIGAGLSQSDFEAKIPIGKDGVERSPLARTARWCQQDMRLKNVIEKVPNKRGVWRLTNEAKTKLHQIERGFVIVGFSTSLGVALWADCRDAMRCIEGEISLVLSSPPYALRDPRAYGNLTGQDYIDCICSMVEAVMPKLARGASLALNLSNDCFIHKLPARELFTERLTIALCDRLGLFKMDTLIWRANKAPAPMQWASRTRQQLNTAFEPILWLSPSPKDCFSDNRRVLQPHTEKHLKLIARGGEKRDPARSLYSDGAYRIREGSFGNPTAGRIPRNVIDVSVTCAGQRAYKRAAQALGLPAHGAPFPEKLAEFLIQFLTAEGMLVADICAGSQTVPVVAERLGRPWVSADTGAEYVRGGATRFDRPWINPDLDALLGIAPSSEPRFNREIALSA